MHFRLEVSYEASLASDNSSHTPPEELVEPNSGLLRIRIHHRRRRRSEWRHQVWGDEAVPEVVLGAVPGAVRWQYHR